MFCPGHADRNGKAELRSHAPPDGAGDFSGRTEQMRAARNVGKGLVDGDAFDERCEIADHVDGGVAQPLVFPKMSADEDELRTQLARLPARHAAAHAESPGFVGSGKHDSAADGNGLAAQRRVKQLLYRGIKGVQVRMQDGGHGCQPDRYPQRFEVCSRART